MKDLYTNNTFCRGFYKFSSLLTLLLMLVSIPKSFTQSLSSFSITGNIKDIQNKAIDGATVLLLNINSSKPAGQQLSSPDGAFTIRAPAGTYQLAVSYVGYRTFSDTVELTANRNVGTIELQPLSKVLKEVLVKSERKLSIIQTEGRKLIYNVAASISAQGTTALEALKKTPGVIAGQDNKLTLNGVNGALILINGKQTYLQTDQLAELLRSMPSSGIKSIEVIKNPSAEYDAAGTGGIINIVMQKSSANGFNGNINTGVAYGVSIKQNSNLNFNYRQGKLNVFGSYNHNFGSFAMDYNNDRTENGKVYINPAHDVDRRKTIGSSIGADYDLSSKQSIGVVLSGNALFGSGTIQPITDIYDEATGRYLQKLISTSNYYDQTSNRYNANGNYRFKDTLGHTFSLDADYGIFQGGNKNLNPNTYYAANGDFQSESTLKIINSKKINLYALSANYGANLWKGKITTGAKFSSVTADNDFNLYSVKAGTDVLDVNRSNFFSYTEQIAAAFVKYEGNVSKKLSYDAGIRMENTRSSGHLLPVPGSSQQEVLIGRNYLNFFPNGSLNLKTDRSGTFNLSYSRRTDRPAYNDLNPFELPIDELSYWKGNPFLQPQYANSLSFQYSYQKTTAALSYTHVTNLSMGVYEVSAQNIIYMVPKNIGSQSNVNLTLTRQLSPARFWDITLTGIGYHVQNKVNLDQYGYYNPRRFAGSLNTQQSFKLPFKLMAEVFGVFNSRTLSGPNGYQKGNSQVDLGLQKKLMQDKAALRLAFTDIYKGNRINSYTFLNGLYQHGTYVGESRQVRLNFSYKFGSNKIREQKEHQSGLQNENGRL